MAEAPHKHCLITYGKFSLLARCISGFIAFNRRYERGLMSDCKNLTKITPSQRFFVHYFSECALFCIVCSTISVWQGRWSEWTFLCANIGSIEIYRKPPGCLKNLLVLEYLPVNESTCYMILDDHTGNDTRTFQHVLVNANGFISVLFSF